MWNRSYHEARVPNVPTMLLELLSSKLADMRYGLDRFSVYRQSCHYKGMLKFVASQYSRAYVVQPLPVKDFSAIFSGDTEVELNGSNAGGRTSAMPTKYIVYTLIDDGGFDNGMPVTQNDCKIKIEKDKIYSFKITAVNDGGESFPSEILSVCRKSDEKGITLIVNGFTRISGPFSFTTRDTSRICRSHR